MPEHDAPVLPVNTEDLPWVDWSEGTRFGSRYRVLSNTRAGARIGVIVEELAPGKQSAPAHYHHGEEEHVLVLDGHATLRLGPRRLPLGPGDYVRFPAGQTEGHCLLNEGTEVCRYVVIGDRNPLDVCVYTDTGRIAVEATGEIYDKTQTFEYWSAEKTT